MNVAMLLEMAAGSFGDREAVRCGDLALAYTALERTARVAAAALRASGCAHAALLDETSPAVPIGLFAAGFAGVPFAPLSYRATAAEIDALLARLAPAHLVAGAEHAARCARAGSARVAR
ncbi:MAG: AMP-dependent synthetase, partial [Proteobacteria bacterium]